MDNFEKFYQDKKKYIEFALKNIREKKAYTPKKISKKSGGYRDLLIPIKNVKNIQFELKILLMKIYKPSNVVHSFLKERSIKTNAFKHLKKYFVINIDIKDFFDNINFGRVRGLFLAKPYLLDEKLATKLAQLTAYSNKLPQGSPTSPIISNMICLSMDSALTKLAKEYRCIYTRYSDDITFSTNKSNLETNKLLEEIEKRISFNGFKINEKKTRIQKGIEKKLVTGLKVNEKINIDRKYVKTIRAMLHNWYKDGISEASKKHFDNKLYKYQNKNKEDVFMNVLLGKISFLALIKGKDIYICRRFLYDYYLLKFAYLPIVYREQDKSFKFEEFERFNIDDIFLKTSFSCNVGSILIHVEGITDIVYIKLAFKYFRDKGEFKDLRLKFINYEGCGNVIQAYTTIYTNKKGFGEKVKGFIKKNAVNLFILDYDHESIKNILKIIRTRNVILF